MKKEEIIVGNGEVYDGTVGLYYKFRNWLIELLAGKDVIILNTYFGLDPKGGLPVVKDCKNALIADCVFDGVKGLVVTETRKFEGKPGVKQ